MTTKVQSEFITDSSVTTAKLADDAVTTAKLGNITTITSSGDITLDATGDIILDADGDDIKIAEGGTVVMEIKHESSSIDFSLNTGDEDFKFRGIDGGNTVTALQLDMSDAGYAYFSSGIDVAAAASRRLRFTDADGTFRAGIQAVDTGGQMIGTTAQHDFAIRSQSNLLFSSGGNTERMRIASSSGNVGIGITDPDHKLEIGAAHSQLKLTDTDDDNYVQMSYSSDYLAFRMNSTTSTPVLALNDSNKVGIGASSPAETLSVADNGSMGIGIYKSPDGVLRSAQKVMAIGTGSSGNNSGSSGGNEHAILQMFHDGDEDIRLYTQGNSWITGGNVGIGTTSPSNQLHVNVAGSNDVGTTISNGQYDYTLGIDTSDSAQFKLSRHTGLGNYDLIKFHPTTYNAVIPSGSLHIGTTATTDVGKGGLRLVYGSGESDGDKFFIANGGASNAQAIIMYVVQAEGFNTSHGALAVGRHTGNNRSINAGGTINASGADYAEYMVKSSGCGDIAKGDVVGVDADGKLTKTFSAAKSFVIKSTDPSYVGGDTWWTEKEPEPKYTDDTKSEKTDDFKDWETRMEAARAKMDRIAFSGQVPVNITGSFSVGDYVYPQANGSNIECVAKTTPTFEEYQLCVGKIWTTMDDGRPLVAVKIG